MRISFTVGVDEVGRGPLAGPLLVAAVSTRQSAHSRRLSASLSGIRDSKKLSEQQREAWFLRLRGLRDGGLLDWRVSLVTPAGIDRRGMSYALRVSVARALAHLSCAPSETRVLLDGSLHAPRDFAHQETIVHGEDREPLIAAASIVAKVSRDRRMRRYAEHFPEYGFDTHKGYGTAAHRDAIERYGTCVIHRESFLSRVR